MSIGTIKKDVSRLPLKDRAELAHWILENLETEAEDQDTVDASWRREIRQRVDDIESGKTTLISAEKVWKDILGD